MTRKLKVTDAQDRPISQDGALPWKPTPIIGAWGDDKEISYHGTDNRVKGTVRFYQSGTRSAEGASSHSRRWLTSTTHPSECTHVHLHVSFTGKVARDTAAEELITSTMGRLDD